ncbi:hypothetical protein AHAS_Ahas11G0172300 [Arachis hypogaea]
MRSSLFVDDETVQEIDKSRLVRKDSPMKIELVPYSKEDRVYHRKYNFEFFYMHRYVLQELRVKLPFTNFECAVLK